MEEHRFARTLTCTDRASVRPLYVNNIGYYRNLTQDVCTRRPDGRSDFQLVLALRGTLTCRDCDWRTTGGLRLYRPHEMQDYVYGAGADTLYYFLHFSGRAAESYVHDLLPARADLDTAALLPLLRAIEAELRAHEPGFEARAAGRMLCLFGEIPRRMQCRDCAMQELAERLNRHMAQPLSAPCFAMLHGPEGRSMGIRFRAYAGQTPLQYQRQLRMAEAARLLTETARPVAEIAAEVGYADALYFSRVFRAHFGKSPTDYRSGK